MSVTKEANIQNGGINSIRKLSISKAQLSIIKEIHKRFRSLFSLYRNVDSKSAFHKIGDITKVVYNSYGIIDTECIVPKDKVSIETLMHASYCSCTNQFRSDEKNISYYFSKPSKPEITQLDFTLGLMYAFLNEQLLNPFVFDVSPILCKAKFCNSSNSKVLEFFCIQFGNTILDIPNLMETMNLEESLHSYATFADTYKKWAKKSLEMFPRVVFEKKKEPNCSMKNLSASEFLEKRNMRILL